MKGVIPFNRIPTGSVKLLERRLRINLTAHHTAVINSYNPRLYAVCKTVLWDVVEPAFKSGINPDEYPRIFRGRGVEERQKLYVLLFLLKQKGLLVDTHDDEEAALKTMQSAALVRKRLGPIYLIPFMGCNFRCPHCLFYSGKMNMAKSGQELGMETLDAFLKYLRLHLDEVSESAARLRFIFYGGEPLMRKDAVFGCIDAIQSAAAKGWFGKRSASILLLTNGSLLSRQIVDHLKSRDVAVGVSLDGLEEYNRLHRRAADSADNTFDRVISGIRLIEAADLQYGLSITLSSRNIEHGPELLGWIAKNLRTKNLSINLMRCLTGGPFVDRDTEHILKRLPAVHDAAQELGFNDQRLLRYQYLKYDEPYRFYCGAAGGTQIVLTPDGRVSSCHGDIGGADSCFKKVEEFGNPAEEPVFSRWRRISPLYMRHCIETCPFYSICSSGCPRNAGAADEDSYVPSESSCAVERYYMTRGIREMLHAST